MDDKQNELGIANLGGLGVKVEGSNNDGGDKVFFLKGGRLEERYKVRIFGF